VTQPLFHVDAFTDRPFAGNPAAVCPLDGPADAAWMQSVAAEMNLSETAFPWPEGDGVWRLRWFTPTVEVDLCGHATLAAAHVLWSEGVADAPEIAFETRSGRLTATREAIQGKSRIWLDFPAVTAKLAPLPDELQRALCGMRPIYTGKNAMDWVVELVSADHVRRFQPDLALLARVKARGLVVTAAGDAPGVDFVSRFFAPAAGIDEDPVTGSAHCCLGPLWGERLKKTDLTGYQCSARGGAVHMRLKGDRVHLGGAAVTVVRGEIC